LIEHPVLHIITTVGQHPRGLGLHLRNLRWAFAGCDFRIHVQTFENWGFGYEDVNYLTRQVADPFAYYNFWDETASHLATLLDYASAFLFMQQDILFTKPARSQLMRCVEHQRIVPNLESPHLSIYRQPQERIYPRIWEGATMLPAGVVAEAIENNVTLGSHHSMFKPGGPLFAAYEDKLDAHYTTKYDDEPGHLARLTEFLDRPDIDTMFELSLYCFCTSKPCTSAPANYRRCELGEFVVHLRGPESAHRDCPGIYDDPFLVRGLPWFHLRSNDLAFMFLLAGTTWWSEDLQCLLLNPTGLELFETKVARLADCAQEWMSRAELKQFARVRDLLDRMAGPSAKSRSPSTEQRA
jgi:hypothetical protein